MLTFLVFCFSIFDFSLSAKIPNEIEKCSWDDDKCLIKGANYVLKNFFAGNPSMGLLPLDPVAVDEVSIIEDKDNAKERKPISINLWFKNWEIHGLKNTIPKRLGGFAKDNAKKIIIDANVPQLQLVGHYKINGQVLVLPIQGEGNSNLTLVYYRLEE